VNIVFLGDFKLDFNNPCLPFEADSQIIANFECAIAENFNNGKNKAYPVIFKPSAIDAINNISFSALNIANNHVYDAGDEGFSTLQSSLKQFNKIQTFGTIESPWSSINIGDKKCAIIGSLEPCRSRGKKIFPQENVKKLILELKSRYDYIIVTPHWGKEAEYALYPSPAQRGLARQWIHAGASAVLGHHSHTVHGYEWIDGKPVFYSLGNFLFEHEESKMHPLTGIGAAIEWDPQSDKEPWKIMPFFSDNGHIQLLEGDSKTRWLDLYNNLSQDLKKRRSLEWIRWARATGPVYIPKNKQSWKKRFRGRKKLKNYLIWLIWTLLPINILLRIAAYFPDSTAAEFKHEIENFIHLTINTENKK